LKVTCVHVNTCSIADPQT